MKFGDILSELREDRGLTQIELSKQLHISNSSISAYENGTRLPSIDILLNLAEFFDVTTDYLLGQTTDSVSPSLLKKEYINGASMASVIKKMLALTTDQRNSLYTVIESFSFYTDVRRKTTTEGDEIL